MTNNDDLALKMKEVGVHRIAACVSACEGISTENLINNVPLKQGLSGLNKRIRDLESQRDELLAEREALNEPVSPRYTLPPHIYRELVNQLRDTAVKYQGCQQLREQISETLSTVITPATPEQKEGSA